MRVLIAEDEKITRRLLKATLDKAGYEVTEASDGQEAMEQLCSRNPPPLALLDWNMPELTGPEVCQAVREHPLKNYVYMILVTARVTSEDAVVGLHAGADDFVRKPFDPPELLARLKVGERILNLEANLEKKLQELQAEKDHVHQLQGLLPMCMHCRKVRTDPTNWQRIETYLEARNGTKFSHGLCEHCLEKHYPQT